MTGPSNPFLPGVWSDSIVKAYTSSSVFGDAHPELSPDDVWNDPDPGEAHNYQEAVAWARLVGIKVLKPLPDSYVQKFILLPPNGGKVTLPICSPTELIETLRRLAAEGEVVARIAADSHVTIERQ